MKKFSFLVYSLAVLFLLTVIKFYINVKTTDPSNGFFLKDEAGVGTVLSVIFFVLIISVLCVAFFTKLSISKSGNILRPVLSFLVSASIIFDLFTKSGADASSYKIYWYLTAVSAVFSAVFFIFYGLKRHLNREIPKILFILPTVYWILRLITVFISYTTLASTLDHTILLLTVCGLLVSSLIFGKTEADIPVNNASFSSAFVCSAAILAVAYSVSNIFIVLSGHGEYLHSIGGFNGSMLFFGIFLYSLVF